MVAKRDLEEAIVHLKMESSAFLLRFQHIIESKEEDHPNLMTELLTNALQKTKQEMRNNIDETYRIFTNYAWRHKLLRKVHVRFTRKTVRDEVYGRTRDEEQGERNSDVKAGS
uniref:Uncharacterized protein n=1 Tax=Micrurus surinamensis TaxID=129470 RepID=A0A2D4PWK5_MICSU